MRKWKKLAAAVLALCLLPSFPCSATVQGPAGGRESSGQVSLEAPGENQGVQGQVTQESPSRGQGDSGQVTGESPSRGQGDSGQVTGESPSRGQEVQGQVTGESPSRGQEIQGQVTGESPSGGGGNTVQAVPEGPLAGRGESDPASQEDLAGGTAGPGQAGTSAKAAGLQGQAQTPPAKPEIQAEGAVVMDAATGTVLYGKNETSRFYPASITKLMTAMLVLERTDLDDMVTFSRTATTNLESGASTLKLAEGDRLTVEQCLYGLLLKSANEIGNALAEHVSGSVEGFARLMNEKAAELGCAGTHFANPHGLNDSNHYTTPYDMALIARAAFQNQTLREIDTTLSYQFPATAKGEARTITMGHKMMFPDDSRYYEGIIGGKTGYTSIAGNTLVTGAERNGVRLVAVVMKSKSTHYADTKQLLDYGFAVMGQTAAAPGWNKDDRGWYYILENGQRAAGQWLKVDQADYWIDPDGYMATGWRQFAGGEWCYFRSGGARAVNYWVRDNGKWFYLGDQGVMLKNTRTPDGYRLGADGAWIQ